MKPETSQHKGEYNNYTLNAHNNKSVLEFNETERRTQEEQENRKKKP